MKRPGLAKARRGAFISKGVLSREAEMLILGRTSRLSEGEPDSGQYFGSTMFQVPLAALQERWRGTLDAAELLRAVEGSVRLRIRFMRIAVADARHRAPKDRWGTFVTETRVRLANSALHVDVDVEAALDDAESSRHGSHR
ncbi:MAG: hypothetical protein AAF411_27735 [Myxococcota bacterium]